MQTLCFSDLDYYFADSHFTTSTVAGSSAVLHFYLRKVWQHWWCEVYTDNLPRKLTSKSSTLKTMMTKKEWLQLKRNILQKLHVEHDTVYINKPVYPHPNISTVLVSFHTKVLFTKSGCINQALP